MKMLQITTSTHPNISGLRKGPTFKSTFSIPTNKVGNDKVINF